MGKQDYLLLKWGTIKGYSLKNSPETFELMKQYYDDGVCMSVAMQEDSDRQKELIIKMIDSFSGTISNDWDGTVYTNKEDAKKYVLNYGKEK